jgi:hypothetical protein
VYLTPPKNGETKINCCFKILLMHGSSLELQSGSVDGTSVLLTFMSTAASGIDKLGDVYHTAWLEGM